MGIFWEPKDELSIDNNHITVLPLIVELNGRDVKIKIFFSDDMWIILWDFHLGKASQTTEVSISLPVL
jgi:hypothetical protein